MFDVKEIIRDIKKLGLRVTNYYHHTSAIETINGKKYEMKCWCVETYTGLYTIFKSLGLVSGRRTEKSYEVPKFVMEGSKEIKREFVSGYYGGDGRAFTTSFYKKKATNSDRYGLEKVMIFLSKDLKNLESGIAFLMQIYELVSCLINVKVEFNVKIREWSENEIKKVEISRFKSINVKEHKKK